jgi:uncharacterized protein (UPF0548 family)
VRCGKCGRPLYVDVNRYRCASGPGLGCGGVAVRSDMLEEYVTGAVLDALESPRVQQAVTAGADTDALRRAELLAEIRKAQDKRAEARRDWAEDVIDKEDWLDIKQRTDDRRQSRPQPGHGQPGQPGAQGIPGPRAADGSPAPADGIRLAALVSSSPAAEQGCLVMHDRAMGLRMLLAEVSDRLAGAELTYQEVGATAGDLPAGYRHFACSVPVGHGRQIFARAGDAVCGWRVQLGAGLQVSASARTAAPGAVVILGLGIGPIRLRAPCRVVYTVGGPRRRGFAYGTLAGHPESGEEAFMIEHHDHDTVSLKITAFSRPATRLAKLTSPVGAIVQRQVTARYLRSLGEVARP